MSDGSKEPIPEKFLRDLLSAKLSDLVPEGSKDRLSLETNKLFGAQVETNGDDLHHYPIPDPGDENNSSRTKYPNLGHFQIEKQIGIGGMGIVFAGRDENLNRVVAIKVMKPQLAADHVAASRFIREAQAMAAIQHPNVATIYHVGRSESDNTPFLVMEFLKDGQTLKQYFACRNLMSFDQAIDTIRQIATGIKVVHDMGLVHRDIKPDNLWVSNNGQIKILDFGLARQTIDDDANLTQTGQVMGSPAYMSPEQSRSEPTDHRSDLFSLGAVFFEMLTGISPFARESVTGTLVAVSSFEPSFEAANEEVPEPLQRIIERLLNKDPRSRTQSSDELIDSLDRYKLTVSDPIISDATLSAVRVDHPMTEPPKKEVFTPALAKAPSVFAKKWMFVMIIASVALACIPAYLLLTYMNQDFAPAPEFRPKSAISPFALVRNPAELDGVKSWTVETPLHRASIDDLSFSPDKQWLATTSEDGSVRIWTADNVQLSRIFLNHNKRVRSLCWSPDSKYLAGVSDTDLFIWEIASWRLLKNYPNLGEGLSGLSWSPTGTKLLVAGRNADDEYVLTWNFDSRQQDRKIRGYAAGAWLYDGNVILHSINQKTLDIFDIQDGKKLKSLGKAVEFLVSANGKIIAMSDGKEVGFIDIETQKGFGQTVLLPANKTRSEFLSRDGNYLVTLGDQLDIWQVSNGQKVWSDPKIKSGWLERHKSHVFKAIDGINNQEIYCWLPGTFFSKPDNLIRINLEEKAQSGAVLAYSWANFASNINWPTTTSNWSRDGKILPVNFKTMNSIWLVETSSAYRSSYLKSQGGDANSAVWSNDNESFYFAVSASSAQSDGINQVSKNENDEFAVQQKILRDLGKYRDASSTGNRLLFAKGNQLSIYDLNNERLLNQFTITDEDGFSRDGLSKLSPDGTKVATTTNHGKPTKHDVYIWDAELGKQTFTINGVNGSVQMVQWSHDGKYLATLASSGEVRIWDGNDGSVLNLEPETNEADGYTGISWRPGTHDLYLRSESGAMRDWRLGTDDGPGKPRIDGLLRNVSRDSGSWSIKWSPDGNTYAIETDLGTVQVHDTIIGELNATIIGAPPNKLFVVLPTGHYIGSIPNRQENNQELLYVIETAKGEQKLLTYKEMQRDYEWTNDPLKISLVNL